MMDASEYKRRKQQDNVLHFSALNATRTLLIKAEHFDLVRHIDEAIAAGEIDKPSQHHNPGAYTSFYRVGLASNNIEVIIEMLIDLEAGAVDKDGQTTALASFYASLLDEWHDLLLQRIGRDASARSA
ncbi:hypothetical protein LJY25_06095 [Hymenobacter sp. BT175]|uniref:hypothetical protein n=1 Tax=Hymenobacter translucens TaxID=2886507 RepID=UPI001D0DD262|nr:hypothetical protein [Hymenobacter translucens]MCC2546008.1 hypothetical protein [Hymenobacter translucens]